MPSNIAALTPAKRKPPDFQGDCRSRQFLPVPAFGSLKSQTLQGMSGISVQNGYLFDVLEHKNKENILNGPWHKEREGRLALESKQFGQTYPDFAGYQSNEYLSYVSSSASNHYVNNISLPNCSGDGNFMLGYGLPSSEVIGMPTTSFIPSSTTLNTNPLVPESDMVTNSRFLYPWSNVQPKSLQALGCHSQLQLGHSFLTAPEQAYSMKYRPFKRETHTPWKFSSTPFGDSDPFHHLGEELSPYQQDGLLNAPIPMSNQSKIWHPVPQAEQKGVHVPLNKFTGDFITMWKKVVQIQSIFNLCNHTLGCLEACDRVKCKHMKHILSHCLNCQNNVCEQWCAQFKTLLVHYENCVKNDCRMCPPDKISLGKFYKFNSGSTRAGQSVLTSDGDPSSVKHMIKGHHTSSCTSCASEVIDIELTSSSSERHVSKNEEQKNLNSLSERMGLENIQSPTFLKVNNEKVFVPEVDNLNLVSGIVLEANHVSSDKVVVEGGWKNLEASSPLPCKEELFEELTSIEFSSPSSQQIILESQDLITSKDSVKEMELEGDAKHVPSIQCKSLEISMHSLYKDVEVDNDCAENILWSRKLKYPELNFDGLNATIEVHQNVNPVPTKSQSEQKLEQIFDEAGGEVNSGTSFSLAGSKVGKEPERTISLLNLFTPEGVRVHIGSLTQSINLDKSTTKKTTRFEPQKNKSCSLCGMDKLCFQPPLRYCSACMKQINPHGVFYSTKDFDNTASSSGILKLFCNTCYTASRENIRFVKESIPKSHLEQRSNYAETDAVSEELVQCDKCKEWLHEICALFNGKLKNEKSTRMKYTCPFCCLNEIENGMREPLPSRLVIGAKELPRTKLSDHIEQWLFRRLEEERQERAKTLGKSVAEVSTAEDLIVRVVSSVDREFGVKPCIREIFPEDKYPHEFSYKSKAVMLFQVIDGADVLIFAMYVQEYGSECSEPNRRHVCISYIDSAKYFRPEIRAVTGEALRTFVYHELLIGYLDYCKRRYFTSCYIWACPPSKDDDYIFYCHPRTQKIPKSDKLRDWYQKMIRKASKRGIVMENTNLYDHFFIQISESKAKITAARLPYFDMDYWPGEAEFLLQNFNGSKPVKKAKKAKAVVERALRAARRDASFIENEMDALLMNNLGDAIRPIKEDFMVLFLHHTCRHCCQPIIFGGHWICNTCKNVQLCERCHGIEEKLQYKDRHPINARDKHSFHRVEAANMSADTTDVDEIKQCEIFNTRLEFLNFCQGNHYQFDTLRRAKHSTMMILDHLHNPAPPVFESSNGGGMNNDQCDSSHHKEVNDQQRLLLNTRLESTKNGLLMDALLHASKCGDRACAYAHCRRLKAVFHHGVTCSIRKKGGCEVCAKMWHLILLHANSCTETECRVPRCRDMKQQFQGKLTSIIRRNEGRIKKPESEACIVGGD
ncbi:Histone acetyltransferase HAC1 [Platanthera zijinensis]|uniref:histone acetyltransferase n=1 Tax=Platanthera zijinensis TaxID=2320716 RepID=A0AAP0AT36_9ASPA